MFTGIIQTKGIISHIQLQHGLTRYQVTMPQSHLRGIQLGASIAIDGVCQTVVKIEENGIWFEAIQETLNKTTLQHVQVREAVNVERSAKIGDEIGGHLLSGHIFGLAELIKITSPDPNNRIFTFHCLKQWMKYIMPKGYIAINGASLTVVDARPQGEFSVHLIPETLERTTFSQKQEGDFVNIELDNQTLTLVTTLERILPQELTKYTKTPATLNGEAYDR
ncbi:MAG TPA: riboflavin synthase subunit alpha [Gammaproteobacteria bacterium]|nr:riboflavin synthase subunit alpha [Gammaproteobacteria bacterium]